MKFINYNLWKSTLLLYNYIDYFATRFMIGIFGIEMEQNPIMKSLLIQDNLFLEVLLKIILGTLLICMMFISFKNIMERTDYYKSRWLGFYKRIFPTLIFSGIYFYVFICSIHLMNFIYILVG